MEKERIAISMGDAGGIGPEVAVKASMSEEIQKICHPCLIGDMEVMEVLEEAARISGVCLDTEKTEVIQPQPVKGFLRGGPSPESGKASYIYIKYAADGCLRGDFHAMVTAPISKEALRMAGLPWPGHTEMLAELTSSNDAHWRPPQGSACYNPHSPQRGPQKTHGRDNSPQDRACL